MDYGIVGMFFHLFSLFFAHTGGYPLAVGVSICRNLRHTHNNNIFSFFHFFSFFSLSVSRRSIASCGFLKYTFRPISFN
jgi:hypothetical protein